MIVERSGEHQVPLASKEAVADAILDRVEALRSGSVPRAGPSAELAILRLRLRALLHWVHDPGPDPQNESLYSLYRRGMELLEDGDFEEATVPLKEAARQAPEKSSVREALGRALFRTRHYAEAATEFEAVVETHPVNDYAHFCLGRALSKTGRDAARPPSPGAGVEPAARAARLPHLQRAPRAAGI